LLDLFRVHGYELVMPPLLEYLDSLLTGSGQRPEDCVPSSWSIN
jgi:ATP phosphoribosyltransferase regulatory subunit HisZ